MYNLREAVFKCTSSHVELQKQQQHGDPVLHNGVRLHINQLHKNFPEQAYTLEGKYLEQQIPARAKQIYKYPEWLYYWGIIPKDDPLPRLDY